MRTDSPQSVYLKDYDPYAFEIQSVRIAFDLEPTKTRVDAKLQVKRKYGYEGEAFRLDGEGLKLKAIAINGRELAPGEYAATEKSLTIQDVPHDFTLLTSVEIDPSKNTALSGLYISADRFCSQCEATGFRHIMYWPDRPDVMSRFTVRIEADKADYPILLSNGSLEDRGDLEGGKHYAVWDDPHPKPSYLFALCAGDYDVFEDSFTTIEGRKVDLAVHVDKGEAAKAAWAMDSLKRSMKWDEEVFGRAYDLDVFNIVAVRDFNFGAMENKGLNIFNSAYVLADQDTATDFDFEAIESIVAHEYFHNWTGNRITCRDWFQLCLKEGLTVFRDQEFSADMRSRPVQRIKDVIRLRARQFAEDAGPLAHAVRPAAYGSIDNLYTATVYEKGAELIRMLKTLIGDDAFSAGMKIYFDTFDGKAATIEDFYSCFEQSSGQSLAHFRKWYAQAGTPHLHVSRSWDESGRLTVTIRQENPPTPGDEEKQPMLIPLKLAVLTADGQELAARTEIVATSEHQFTVDAPAGPAAPLLSLNRGFGAPIVLHSDHTDEETAALAAFETDPFNKWDLLQGQIKKALIANAYDGAAIPAALPEMIANAVTSTAPSDPAFASLLLRLPDVGELFLEHKPADPGKLTVARKALQAAISEKLTEFIGEVLANPSPAPFSPDAEQAGIRALRSAAYVLLSAARDSDRLLQLYRDALNMTESLSTLRALSPLSGSQRDEALAEFYDRWKQNDLVLDKWFAAQAAYAEPEAVSRLLDHTDFDLGTPNRVRSVLAVFAMQNLGHFHATDGSGYRVLTKSIAEIDSRNPALAARLLTSFEQWRSLIEPLRNEAEKQLNAVAELSLSKNSSDIITRALSA